MKKFFIVFLLIIFGGQLSAQSVSVVPYPQNVKFLPEKVKLGDSVSFEIGRKSLEAGFIMEKLQNYCDSKGIEVREGAEISINIVFDDDFSSDLTIEDFQKKESYKLVIEPGEIKITAYEEKGAFNGLATLLQILQEYEGREVPALEIVDYPDLAVRGISDDISRGQVSKIENFKKILDFMAKYKMNTFMPYMEDVLELDSYPEIGKNRGALTKDEVREILAYAGKNFIEVVPIFQTLGHYENILLDEKFLKYAEFPGAASLNVSNPETYEFLEKMLTEVFELFPSEYFHMGADESFDVGLGESQHLVEASSIAMVHADHYQKVYDICKKHGKKVIMYGDIILRHPEILERLPKDITIVDWHYRAQYDYPSTETFNSYGHNYYVSPSVWNFLTTFPTNMNSMPNIEYIIKDGMKNGTSGMINSNWGDYGAETIKELIYFGYAWSAQCAWNINASDPGKFSPDFTRSFYGLNNFTADRLYREFSNSLNQMMWHEVWRHPLLDFRPPVWWVPPATFSEVGKINWLQWSASAISRDIEEFAGSASSSAEHAEIFRFLVKLNNWYAEKLTNQLLLQEIKSGDSDEYEKASGQIDNLVTTLEELRDDYSAIWKEYYKPDNLDMIMDKFNRLAAYYGETKRELAQKKISSPEITSDWIYYPYDEENKVKSAEFRKVFDIEGDVESAKLQILADTYAELYINGEFVQKLFARRSLSLLVDYGRIKYLDIKDYLKTGENVIEVKAENYNRSGKAGINILAEIKTKEQNVELKTNSGWMVKERGSDTWSYAVKDDYPYIVIAPDFETDRPSWIER